MIAAIVAMAGGAPNAPTIGTATGGNAQATVAFTPPSYTGKGGAVTYRVLSTPGNITATGSGSPITITGLTNGVSYTFQVRLETSYGVNSAYSAASNAVTPVAPTTTTTTTTTTAAPPTTTTTTTTTTAAPPTTTTTTTTAAPPTTTTTTTTTTAAPTTTTTTTTAAPTTTTTTTTSCTCPGGVPPGGGWTYTGSFYQCAGSGCPPYRGYWEMYRACGGACAYDLFIYCDYGAGPVCPV